jgi:hypothetical protein
MELEKRTLEILSCDIAVRPRTAAGIDDVCRHLVSVHSEAGKLIAHFRVSGKSDVQSFANAEQLCCTSLSWNVSKPDDDVILTVQGSEKQLAEVLAWFSSNSR